jgi:DNA-binding protein H-NS
MATPKIDKLSFAELVELKARIEDTIDERKTEEKAALREKVAELVAEAGFDLEEVVATGRRNGQVKRKTGKVAPKYRNPHDPSETWTGRGRKPNWLVAELEAGRDREEFRIG